MANLRFAPDFRIEINGRPVPAVLRASASSVSLQIGFDGSDRVELALVNEGLRWLDHELLALDNSLALYMGYAPDPLEKMFVGEIVGQSPTFPSGGSPMLTVSAQDSRQHLQDRRPVRWFAVPVPNFGNTPIPDPAAAGLVALEHRLIPIFDPIGAALSVLIGGVQVFLARKDPKMMQRIIRKQMSESNLDFLKRISQENGWEVFIDHSGPRGGWQLRFFSLAEHLAPDVTLKYGQSLIDFTPRITKVGQIASVSVKIWVPSIKTEFTITASWDWDRNSLNVNVSPGFGLRGKDQSTPEALEDQGAKSQLQQELETFSVEKPFGSSKSEKESRSGSQVMLVGEPVSPESAPRVILGKLLSRLNQRLTGSGSTIGDPRIRAGTVLRLEGLGQQFGGLYRVTSATHSMDSGGYRTSFDVRKEVWFGSIPALEQGAPKLSLQGQRIF
jgi:phage protein D